MQFLRSFSEQMLLIWKNSTPAARVGIIFLVALCAVLIGGVGYWSSQPDYVSLASDLDSETMTKLVDALDREGIAFQIRGAGTSVMVDKRNWSKAQQLAKSSGVGVDPALVEDSAGYFPSPTAESDLQRSRLERKLAASIMRFSAVEKAIVHLSLPERQPFIRRREIPSAGVVLTLKKGQKFGESHASAISSIIANSVQNLEPAQITITDVEGNSYTSPDESIGNLSRQDNFRILREQQLTTKAQAQLAAFLGQENVAVVVTADFSYPEEVTTTREYDPNKRAEKDITTIKQSVSGADSISVGSPGTASNLNNLTASNSPGREATGTFSNITTEWDNSYTERVSKRHVPTLNQLSVSVVVNQAAPGISDAAGNLTPNLKEKIEATVKQAVGFRENGLDQINVDFQKFMDIADEPVVANPFPWEQVNQIIQNVSLGLAAVVALFLGFVTIRKLRPMNLSDSGSSSDSSNTVGQLSELMKTNPEVFSQIVSAWASGSQPEAESVSASKAA